MFIICSYSFHFNIFELEAQFNLTQISAIKRFKHMFSKYYLHIVIRKNRDEDRLVKEDYDGLKSGPSPN